MDKVTVKSFAIVSRRKMIESVKYQASLLGITADEIKEPISKADGMETYDFGAGSYTIYNDDIQKRKSLVKEVKNKGFDNVVEEVAYTWFNRIIAIRFMEVNDYLPTRTRVLSSETEGKIEPDIITEALDLDLDYNEEDKNLIIKLMDENKLDELFQFLFIKQCNKLNKILPGLFKSTNDYMELLLAISFTDENSIVRQLIKSIPEEDFDNQVEIIGWLYQFYNSELKDETFDDLKKNIKINKERIPAVTQLFTPDWIVKYMVENSLGRLWLERYPDNELESKWKYYINSDETERNISEIKLQELKVIDPCMGSGHILIYLFELLMQIYVSRGYTEKEATIDIIKYNLYGLDIDDRAYQLSYFAVMMKARSYNRTIFKENITPLLFSIQESNNINPEVIEFINENVPEISKEIEYIINVFNNAKDYGSILNIKNLNYNLIFSKLNDCFTNPTFNAVYEESIKILFGLIKQANILSLKYDSVVTNPPYMSNKGMNKNLMKYLKDNYDSVKKDLFSVFMVKCFSLTKPDGYLGLLTPYVWMYIKSYSDLRKIIIKDLTITTLTQLEYNAFPEACVPVCIITLKNKFEDIKGTYIKLSDFKGESIQEIKTLEAINDDDCDYKYQTSVNNFLFIPDSPIAYELEQNIFDVFKDSKSLSDYIEAKKGMFTGNNKLFLKFWFEINYNDLFGKYKPYSKGGGFRKWYGNNYNVINWENNGELVKSYKGSGNINESYFFKKCITWNLISSYKTSFRAILTEDFVIGDAGPAYYPDDNLYYYSLGCLNTNLAEKIFRILDPTLNFSPGVIKKFPLILSLNKEIDDLVKENISISKQDWDSFELSWDFKKHPFLINTNYIRDSYNNWVQITEERFNKLVSNEKKLNKLFSEIYNVSYDDEINIQDITISKGSYEDDIRSFISFAVGCMFGRYSLDDDGIVFAGGEFNLTNYSKFMPDDDNIIPVLDTEYFEDDVVGRFIDFIKICFGEETLEENLDFIAGALNKKGKTSREIIRNYFLTEFFKNHVQTYKKCPIYWQFDSGKQNAFKCLIYMHRYDPSLVARVRTDYLHKTQKAIEENLNHCESIISKSTNKSELKQARKDKDKFIKQLDEIRDYDEVLAHIAHQQIEIDFDEGIKVNHAKFQNIKLVISGQKSKKVNLLKKI